MIVGVALTGMLTVLNLTGRTGADPDDPQADAGDCRRPDGRSRRAALYLVRPGRSSCGNRDQRRSLRHDSAPRPVGPEAGETRGGAATPFDNVNDYNGLAGITTSITGTPMPAGYTAAITVAPGALGPAASLVPAAASLLITVTVSFNNENLAIEGYRTRYAPNSLP